MENSIEKELGELYRQKGEIVTNLEILNNRLTAVDSKLSKLLAMKAKTQNEKKEDVNENKGSE